MSLPEQSDSSAEHTSKPNIYIQLYAERRSMGSTLGYVEYLGRTYLESPDHKPNLLQLQRMAWFITNPTNEPAFPKELSEAFYWGEIMAYRAQDMLSGGDWARDAYPLFSAAMQKHSEMAQLHFAEMEMTQAATTYPLPERTHLQVLQDTADMIMGELEEAEVEFMPPAMEIFINDMTEELAEFPEHISYMILGFRHITMQVVQAALNADMKKDAEVLSEGDMQQFINMMDKNEIDDIQGRELIAIDEVRERIMESYADHMIAYGTFDTTDEDQVDEVRTFLTQTMNRDFVDMDAIEVEDFLEIGGSAIFMLYDPEGIEQIYMLEQNELLKGSVEAVAIIETPTLQAMFRLQQDKSLTLDELIDSTDSLGVVLMLKDPVLVNADGSHTQAAEGVVAGVVMTNPNMSLSKYLL